MLCGRTNGQTYPLSQELKSGLRYLCSHEPLSWFKNIFWVEYAHNSLPSLTPFFDSVRLSTPSVHQSNAGILSSICSRLGSAVSSSVEESLTDPDKRRLLAPNYQSGQRVWLSSMDLPIQVECKKLPLFVGSFSHCQSAEPRCSQAQTSPSSQNSSCFSCF